MYFNTPRRNAASRNELLGKTRTRNISPACLGLAIIHGHIYGHAPEQSFLDCFIRIEF
jgi:hypothetical protein